MVKSNRTRYEQETILLTNEEDDFWNVFTYNRKLKKKLETFAAECPELCAMDSESSDGSVIYNVSKDRTFINFRKPASEETLRKQQEWAKTVFKK